VPAHEHIRLPTSLWKYLLLGGTLIWLFAALITRVTQDDIFAPTVILVGSYLVPVTAVAVALSLRPEGYLTTPEVVFGFLAAGTVAVVTTALAESYLLPEASGTFIGVGAIEETGKGLVLLAVAHAVHDREPRCCSGPSSALAWRPSRAPATHCTRCCSISTSTRSPTSSTRRRSAGFSRRSGTSHGPPSSAGRYSPALAGVAST
jgi:hypothetical protein